MARGLLMLHEVDVRLYFRQGCRMIEWFTRLGTGRREMGMVDVGKEIIW
jgi:hypothetical protein